MRGEEREKRKKRGGGKKRNVKEGGKSGLDAERRVSKKNSFKGGRIKVLKAG